MTNSVVLVVAIVVATVGGWFWGSNGRWRSERASASLTLRQELLTGRNALLETRLDLYNVNFGEASRHLESARAYLRRASDSMKKLDRVGDVTKLQSALAGVDDAQRMAGSLDQNANTRTAEVVKIVGEVIDAGVTPVAK